MKRAERSYLCSHCVERTITNGSFLTARPCQRAVFRRALIWMKYQEKTDIVCHNIQITRSKCEVNTDQFQNNRPEYCTNQFQHNLLNGCSYSSQQQNLSLRMTQLLYQQHDIENTFVHKCTLKCSLHFISDTNVLSYEACGILPA